MKRTFKYLRNGMAADVGNTNANGAGGMTLLARRFKLAGLLILLFFAGVGSTYAATTVTLSTPASVGTASMCPGTNQQTIYEFTLIATGIFPSTSLTGITFTQSGTATNADITQYELWQDAPGGTLVATSATPSFSGFNTTYNGLLGTTINYWITADISANATAGRTIVVDAMTTADFSTTSGFKTTFGTIAAGGAQTVLLSPTAITGPPAVCVGAVATLGNTIAGGTWTSTLPTVATVGSASGILSGVNSGATTITYQIATGCLKTSLITINPLPNLGIVTGGGNYCAGGAGVHVGLNTSSTGITYQLYNGGTTMENPEGTGTALDFGLETAAGIYSVIATNMTTSCSRTMAGTATVVINPLPTSMNVTGGGSYCAGGTGLHVGLNGSETGVNYRLYRGSNPLGTPVAGTGSALDFGVYTAAGTYTVLATNATTLCTSNMGGSTPISVNALPNVYTVIGGGSYCAGGDGVHVRLTWSQTGIIYVLYNGATAVGSPVAGTGLLLDFGLQTAGGNYSVVAMNATTYCTSNMSGSVTVVVNPVPSTYAVTGGGSYCADGPGLHVGLSSSNTGIMYMLYNGGAISGSPVAGTGAAIDFGLQTAAGIYTVVGVNSTTTCMSNMAGGANININPLPSVYSVTGGGNYCEGTGGIHIGLSSSNTGISYQLYNGTTGTGFAAPGTGASLDFGLQTAEGIYTVVATNNSTMCSKNMSSSASININPLPSAYNVTGGGYYCTHEPVAALITSAAAGGTTIHVGLDGSEDGMIYLLYNGSSAVGSPLAGNGSSLDFGVQYASGVYSVIAINASTLCTKNMADTATITINAVVTPTLSISSGYHDTACAARLTTFSGIAGNGGTAPEYVWKVNGTTVGTAATYSYLPANGDLVYASITSNALCAEPLTANSSIALHVIPAIIPTVTLFATPGTHISPGDPIMFTAEVTNGGTAPLYQWYVNGVATAGATAPTFIAGSLVNNDSVSCTVTRNDACAMSSFNSLLISVGDVSVTDVVTADHIALMPNPNNGTFTIKGSLATSGNVSVRLELTNMIGQVVYSKQVTAANGSIDEQIKLDNVAAGMYLLNVRTDRDNKVLHVVIE